MMEYADRCTSYNDTRDVATLVALCFLGSVFGRTDFSRIFVFGPPDFLADFVAGFFLLIFCGKKCLEKSSRKIPGKIRQSLHNKNPRHISAEWPGPVFQERRRHINRRKKKIPETTAGCPRDAWRGANRGLLAGVSGICCCLL